MVLGLVAQPEHSAWPVWWSAVLALAWAPLLWLPQTPASLRVQGGQLLSGLGMVSGLTLAALLGHALPLGLQDAPHPSLGWLALSGMVLLYFGLALLQWRPQSLSRWRRWSYAGFYVDEIYTRLALRCWPTPWTPEARRQAAAPQLATSAP